MNDYAVFCAAHASVSEAIDACTRPDWLVRLAVESMSDRKEAVRVAVRAARLLHHETDALRLLRPWPGPFEALEVYINYPTFESKPLFQWSRAAMLSLFPAAILTLLINVLVWQSKSEAIVWLVSLVVVVAFAIPFAVLFHALLALVVRKQVANLDDDVAVKKSLALIERGLVKNSRSVPYAMDVVRREIELAAK